MAKYAYNNSVAAKVWCGMEIQPNEYYEIQNSEIGKWANDSTVFDDIASDTLIISKTNAVGGHIAATADAINFLKGETPVDATGFPIYRSSPFTDSLGFRFRGTSFTDTVATGTTKDIDYLVSAERWVNGGRLIVDNIGTGDKLTFQVVDKDNVFGYGAGAVLDQFITDFYIPVSGTLEIALSYPARIYAGLYLRLKYTSTHASGCTVKCNLYLHWKAV